MWPLCEGQGRESRLAPPSAEGWANASVGPCLSPGGGARAILHLGRVQERPPPDIPRPGCLSMWPLIRVLPRPLR